VSRLRTLGAERIVPADLRSAIGRAVRRNPSRLSPTVLRAIIRRRSVGRTTPVSGPVGRWPARPGCARSSREQMQRTAVLFDHLVGAREQRQPHVSFAVLSLITSSHFFGGPIRPN